MRPPLVAHRLTEGDRLIRCRLSRWHCSVGWLLRNGCDEQRGGWVDPWARKHAKQAIVVRALLAPWILFVTLFLCVKGYWWGLVFLPFLALDLWLLRSLVRYARTQGG